MRSASVSVAFEHGLRCFQQELLQHTLCFAANQAANSVVRDFCPVHLLSRYLKTDMSFSM